MKSHLFFPDFFSFYLFMGAKLSPISVVKPGDANIGDTGRAEQSLMDSWPSVPPVSVALLVCVEELSPAPSETPTQRVEDRSNVSVNDTNI